MDVHTIVLFFDTTNFCRITIMTATVSESESQEGQQVERRKEDESFGYD